MLDRAAYAHSTDLDTIAILGSGLLVSIIGLYIGIQGWRSPQRLEQTLTGFLAVQMNDLQSMFIIVCVISLAATAIVYYAGWIIRKMWAREGEKPTSIFGNQSS